MKIKRTSIISGIERVKDIPVNPEDWVNYDMGYLSIDEAMPYLNDEDISFIISGITKDEWENAFKMKVE